MKTGNYIPLLSLLKSALCFLLVNTHIVFAQITISPAELVFDGVKNNAVGPKIVRVQNTGLSPVDMQNLSIIGTNADKFDSDAAPVILNSGEFVDIEVYFLPENSVGSFNASLEIISDAPNQTSINIGLYGLSTNALEGNNEPTLNNVVSTLGYNVDVGWLTLADGVSSNLKGEEVLVQFFQKANSGNVGILPVARYSPQEEIPFGYYTSSNGVITIHQTGILRDSTPHHQTLYPGLVSGSTQFNPGNSFFGIYTLSNVFNRTNYSQDSLNIPSGVERRVRVYPLKNRQGQLVLNSYLICFEDATNGDYQDYVFVLSNVKPAGIQKLEFSPSPNSITLNVGQTGTIGNYLASNNNTDPQTAILSALDNTTNAVPTWLRVNNNLLTGINFTTGSEISFECNATGLQAGIYTASVTASKQGYANATIILTMTVHQPLANFKVNFSDAATLTPSGWLKDYGQAYGLRTAVNQGNGQYTYGWVDTTPQKNPLNLSTGGTTPGNGRNRSPNPDVDTINETFMHMQGDDIANFNGTPIEGMWEVLVPNGFYSVTVRVGDVQNEGVTNTKHQVNVEGLNAVSLNAVMGSPNDAGGTVIVNVSDEKITLDAFGGLNTKIKSVQIQPAQGIQQPSVLAIVPSNGASNVAINSPIAVNSFHFPNPDSQGVYGLDNSTVNSNTVRLYKENGNVLIAANVTPSGGGDAITLTPTMPLENNTAYRFELSSGVKDRAGISFIPFSSTFTTTPSSGGGPTTNLDEVAFTNAGAVATGSQYTTLTIGPDGKLYGLTINGDIHRWLIQADGTLNNKEILSAWKNKTLYNNSRTAIGLVFDPAATANNLIAWISHCSSGLSNAPEWDGNISRLSGVDLEIEQLVVTKLPRSLRDHLTNSIAFKPGEPNILYFNQGSNSAGGAPDNAWGNRQESLLSAAVLKLDLSKLSQASWPLNAQTSTNQTIINNVSSGSATMSDGTYNPYYTQAPLKLFATGLRNAYDLLWHSNGQLYVPTNGTAGGSNTPASVNGTRRPDGTFYDHSNPNYPVIQGTNNNEVQRDWLFRVNPNEGLGYYGHPNPFRGQYVMNRGKQDLANYPNGTIPDITYRGAAFDFEFNKSANGLIEYQSNAENGNLKGAILVLRYSGGDDIIALVPDGINGDIATFKTGIPGFIGFNDPLDLVEDIQTGNIYVSEYGGSKITLLKPSNQASPTPIISLSPSKIVVDGISGLTSGTAQTIFISNTGNAPLENINLTLSGNNALEFELNTNALSDSIAAGQSSSFTVTFKPTSNGPKYAQLVVNGDNAQNKTINLNGLGKQGTGGTNEPSLQWILDTHLGLAEVNAGDDDPSTNIIHSESSQQNAALLGNEVAIQKFQRATDAPVTLQVLSVYGPTSQNPVLGFGWYASGNANARQELFTVSNIPTSNGQSLQPVLNGTLQFDPGAGAFGFYSYWTAFSNRHIYSEDALNTFSGAIPHHVRVYPLPGEENAYIVATEEHISGFDYQDIVVIVRNVKPFVPIQPVLSFSADNLNFLTDLGYNPDAKAASLSSNVYIHADSVSLTSSASWVVLPATSLTKSMYFGINTQNLTTGNYTATVRASANGFLSDSLIIHLEVTRAIGWVHKINFQDAATTTPTGYLKDSGQAFALRTGTDQGNGQYSYGWVDDGTNTAADNSGAARNRNIPGLSVILNTFNHMRHLTPASYPHRDWKINLPNNQYYVKLGLGDPGTDNNSVHTIFANGVKIASFDEATEVAALGKHNASVLAVVSITNGSLILGGGNAENNTKINYVLIAPYDPTTVPPTVSAAFNGILVSPNVYKASVTVSLQATDNTGTGLLSLGYSTDGGTSYTPYQNPIQFNQVGNFTLKAKAEDNTGNVTIQNYSFTIQPYSNAYIALENMTKIPNTNIGFPADDHYTFHKNKNGSTTALKWHKDNTMRIKNTGTGVLTISSVAISNTSRFVIKKINGVNFNQNQLPLNISPNAYADILIEFVEPNGSKGLRTETITINSNADNKPLMTATLLGGYMTSVEGGGELNALLIMQAFGFTTSMNGQPSPSSDYPLTADVDAGVHGDLIVSEYFTRADNTQPVRAFQLAAFKGATASTTKLINSSGGTVSSFSYNYGGDYHQSFLPKSTNTSTVLAGDEANTTVDFRIQVDSYNTSGSGGTNSATGLPKLLGVRVYKVKDKNGKIIPYHYVVIQDFIGSGCGAGSANCDWNDNMQYFMNIRPKNLPTATTISNATTNVGTVFSKNISGSFNKGYAGNKLIYKANLLSLEALPTWLKLDSLTGVFSGTVPFNAAPSMDINVTTTDLNGIKVSKSFVLTIQNTGSSLVNWNAQHLNFNDKIINTTQSLNLNLQNLSSSSGNTLLITSMQIIGSNASEFGFSSQITSIAPQNNRNISISFSPNTVGLKQAVLLIYNNFTSKPIKVPLYGIARLECNTLQVIKRIKSGVNSNLTINGNIWEHDQSYRSGSVQLDAPNVTAIAETNDDLIYTKYLSSTADLAVIQYNIPLQAGAYMLRMHFVENFFNIPGSRVFNATMEGQSVFQNLDIFNEVGKHTALVKSFNVTVGSDNILNIAYSPSANRLALAGVEIFYLQSLTFYADADGDGFGNIALSQIACTQPQGYVANNSDCNDNDNKIYPSAPELCDGKDNNCNGNTDEGCPSAGSSTRYEAETYYQIVTEAGSNVIKVMNVSALSNGKCVNILDIGDKIRINFNTTTAGNYQLKVHSRSGNSSNSTLFWSNGYKHSLDGAVITLTGNPTTLSGLITIGSSNEYYGTMESATLNLTAGTHSLDIEALRTYARVDYLEVISLGGGASSVSFDTQSHDQSKAEDGKSKLAILNVYPNPIIENQVYVNFSKAIFGKVELTLINQQGVIIDKQEMELIVGQKELKIDFANFNLKKGVYYLKIGVNNTILTTQILRE